MNGELQDAFANSVSPAEIAENSGGNKKIRLIQNCKLGILLIGVTGVLRLLATQIISKSVKGISVSNQLAAYMKIDNVIGALQDERATSCIATKCIALNSKS